MTTAGTVRCLCVILSLVVYTESACTYTDHSGGLPSQSGGTVTQLGSLNACKSVCDGQSTCTGVYFTFPRCEWFNIPITLATSAADPVIFTSIRTCTPDVPQKPTISSSSSGTIQDGITFTLTCTTATTSGSLTYIWTVDTTDQAAQSTNTKQFTASLPPKAYTCKVSADNTNYSPTSDVLIRSVKPVTPTVSGPTAISEGASATLTCTTTSSGSMTYAWLKDGTTLSGETASAYTIATATLADSGGYTCSAAYSGVTSDTSSSLTLTVTGACSMTETANSEAVTSAQLTLDLSSLSASCKTACLYVTQCTAFTYDSSTCVLHTSVVSTQARAGFTHVTKCGGFDCCVNGERSGTQGMSAVDQTLAATPGSCKGFCAALSTCNVAVYSGSTCKLFTSETLAVLPKAGSTFYRKICQQGNSSGSLTAQSEGCSRAPALKFKLILVNIALIWAVLL